jgi:hypothetical protein
VTKTAKLMFWFSKIKRWLGENQKIFKKIPI